MCGNTPRFSTFQLPGPPPPPPPLSIILFPPLKPPGPIHRNIQPHMSAPIFLASGDFCNTGHLLLHVLALLPPGGQPLHLSYPTYTMSLQACQQSGFGRDSPDQKPNGPDIGASKNVLLKMLYIGVRRPANSTVFDGTV